MAVDNGAQEAGLEGREVEHHRLEPGRVYGQECFQRLYEERLHHVALGQCVTDEAELVDVADVVPEQLAYAQHQIPVEDLAGGEETSYGMVDDLLGVDVAEREYVDLTVEEFPPGEDILHRVHHRAAEDEGGPSLVCGVYLGEHLLHYVAYLVAVLREHDVLELVEDDDHPAAVVCGYAVGETEHGLEVVVVKLPVGGQDAASGGEDCRVEYEMRVGQEHRHVGGVVGRRLAEGSQHSRAELQREVLDAAYGHQGEIDGDELHAGDLHIEEGLLDEGVLAAFRGFVYGYVLALVEEIPERIELCLTADIILAGYRFIENELRHSNILVIIQN